MRKVPARAEQKLWECLRAGRLGGFKFRRQHPMPPYVVDFYCDECRLVVEADGDSHVERVGHDAERTRWMNGQGVKVIRFENRVVFEAIDLVLEEIYTVCLERRGERDR
jgi:very-short-patch-repair endonuclease